MSSCTISATIDWLQHIFVIWPSLISDNGLSFSSSEFKIFDKENGMVHHTTAPYHPASNGQAESIQVVKNGLKKSEGLLGTRLLWLLFRYRATPQTTIGVSPAELVFGRPLRTCLDLVFPDIAKRVQKGEMLPDASRPTHLFDTSDIHVVLCRNLSHSGNKWLLAVIKHETGPMSYKVLLPEGHIVRRDANQLHSRARNVNFDVFDQNLQYLILFSHLPV